MVKVRARPDPLRPWTKTFGRTLKRGVTNVHVGRLPVKKRTGLSRGLSAYTRWVAVGEVRMAAGTALPSADRALRSFETSLR